MSPRDWCIGRTAIVRIFVRAAAALALLALLGPAAARGDDRDLLRTTIADPYLFILLDTSGSMNWSPKSAACPTGDCFVPMQADDPTSKFYQAKEALYEVLTDPGLPKVALGFATYNQDQLAVTQKHWLYEASGERRAAHRHHLLPGRRGARGLRQRHPLDLRHRQRRHHEIGCAAATPADLDDIWELTRVRRLPKGGRVFAAANVQTFYIRTAGITYKVTYTPVTGGTTAAPSTSRSPSSSATTPRARTPRRSARRRSTSRWSATSSPGTTRPPPTRTAPIRPSATTPASPSTPVNNNPSCGGWDPNTDTASDKNASGYSLRWPTDSSDPRGTSFTLGDVIPLDWKTDHKIDILKRLAPNYVDSSTVPDFRIAPYLANDRSAPRPSCGSRARTSAR